MRLAFANSITLSAITAGLWVVLWGPAYGLAGTSGVQGLSFAAVLCVVPGCVVLLLSSCSSDSNEPLYQAAAR